jgi:hypothetical protein
MSATLPAWRGSAWALPAIATSGKPIGSQQRRVDESPLYLALAGFEQNGYDLGEFTDYAVVPLDAPGEAEGVDADDDERELAPTEATSEGARRTIAGKKPALAMADLEIVARHLLGKKLEIRAGAGRTFRYDKNRRTRIYYITADASVTFTS